MQETQDNSTVPALAPEEPAAVIPVIVVVLDTREDALLAALQRLNPAGSGVAVRVEPLPVADIAIRPGEPGTDAPPLMLLERKTLGDLAASIVDGRYREQKARLLAAVDTEPHKAAYVVEGGELGGDPAAVTVAGGVKADALWGAIVNSQCRDMMRVFRTADPAETALLVLKLAKFHARATVPGGGIRGSMKTPTAARAAVEGGFFAGMLTQVPGCSLARAAAVTRLYPAPAALCAALHEDRAAAERAIADLRVDAAGGGGGAARRIGPALAAAIASVMLGGTAPPRGRAASVEKERRPPAKKRARVSSS